MAANPKTQGAREVFGTLAIGDTDTVAKISTEAVVGDTGLVVMDPRMDDLVTALNAVLEELRGVNAHLNILTELES